MFSVDESGREEKEIEDEKRKLEITQLRKHF